MNHIDTLLTRIGKAFEINLVVMLVYESLRGSIVKPPKVDLGTINALQSVN